MMSRIIQATTSLMASCVLRKGCLRHVTATCRCSQERKQWPGTEESSNCSDESSSNNGADWLAAAAAPEMLGVYVSRDQHLAAKEAFNNAALVRFRLKTVRCLTI